ncbi:hypothetical protein HGM15179_002662 [Zosterops borbonicus]|uniref:Uncharacterized protein n=1 Tax=Zosterops borbonicus TaxID=364589 RepID=A0A8K1LRT7_9PASS|nr:hypothetical protein HGM15179_002662 [Zosterops borbonicus]
MPAPEGTGGKYGEEWPNSSPEADFLSVPEDGKGEDLNHCQGADSLRKKRRINAVFCETRQKGGVRESVLHMENIAGEPMTQKVMTGSCKI